MSRSKYINTFNTTAEYDAYIESAYPEFPNVGYDKEAGVVNIRRQSPNDYQIWGTTTATENFNIKLNGQNVEVTVDPDLGEFYLTGWTGTLTSLKNCINEARHITSIKKFALDTSNVSRFDNALYNCVNMITLNFNNVNVKSDLTTSSFSYMWLGTNNLTDIYLSEESALMAFTNNLHSQGDNYIRSSATIHYNDVDYKWQNNAWTPQS
jgi:hypothetical protein